MCDSESKRSRVHRSRPTGNHGTRGLPYRAWCHWKIRLMLLSSCRSCSARALAARRSQATNGSAAPNAQARGSSLLIRECFAKSPLGTVDVTQVAGPIDERAHRVLGADTFAQLALHAEHVRMRGQENICRQAP